MLAYTIKSIIYLSIMYLPYMLLLKNESFFRFNRLMLIVIMLLSLVLPLCDFHFLSVGNSPVKGIVEIGMPVMIFGRHGSLGNPSATEHTLWDLLSGGSWASLLARIYIIGMIITLLWKLKMMINLHRQIRQGVLWKDITDGVTIYCHARNVAPYSWFRQIVISDEDYRNNAEEILRHEMGHIRHGHSWDILLLNAVQVLQWVNPFVWLLGSSLRDVHEYEADDAVLSSGIKARQYQMLLIRKAVGSSSYTFANSFNHSLLTKRVTMMLRKKSSPWMRTKGLYIIPVAVIALSAFATPELNNKVDNIIEPQRTSVGKINQNPADHQIIDGENDNPVVSGLLEGILGGLMESDKEGTNETGTETDTIKVEKMLAKKSDIVTLISNGENMTPKLLYFFDGVEVSYATICKMNVDNIAGVHILNAEQGTKAYGEKGQYGVVYITTKNAETVKDDEVLEICEKLPEYPGGMQELMTYLSQTVRYPIVAMEQDVQGRAIVNFIVEKDGSISNVKSQNFHAFNNVKQEDTGASEYEKKSSEDDATADNDDYVKAYQATQALIQEAERVVKSMPNWEPGMQDGKQVRVRYTIPITFRLQ